MADLSTNEARTLEVFFRSGRPNNWFATHAELGALFTKYELSKFGYVEEEGTKTERMRVVWKVCPNHVVSKLLLELLDIGFAEQVEPSEEWLAGYEA